MQTFRNPKPELLALLAESGAADANGIRTKDAAKKKNRRDKNVDMEKLADGLQKLGEDDLLHVVTLVHDNKTSETYTKNDVESEYTNGKRNKGDVLMNADGEFHVDLYTLPDSLVKMLWDFTASKTEL
jgi:transcription initiation factor IIF auxiliary subunit